MPTAWSWHAPTWRPAKLALVPISHHLTNLPREVFRVSCGKDHAWSPLVSPGLPELKNLRAYSILLPGPCPPSDIRLRRARHLRPCRRSAAGPLYRGPRLRTPGPTRCDALRVTSPSDCFGSDSFGSLLSARSCSCRYCSTLRRAE